MPALPDLTDNLIIGTGPVADSGLSVDEAEDGTVYKRVLHPNTVYELTMVYAALTDAELATMETFYESNKTAVDITTTFKGYTYTTQFIEEPRAEFEPAGWRLELVLKGTRA